MSGQCMESEKVARIIREHTAQDYIPHFSAEGL